LLSLLIVTAPALAEEPSPTPTVEEGVVRHELPRSTVSLSAATWGYRQGFGTRLELAPAVSLTTSLDLFKFNVGFVSHTGVEAHPTSLYVGKAGWIVPTLGIGAYATGGFAALHGQTTSGAGLYAAPGVRWTGPRGRSSVLLGATGRYHLNGEQGLDPIALTLGYEMMLGKRSRGMRPPLPDFGALE
jgi:hypothetical protein